MRHACAIQHTIGGGSHRVQSDGAPPPRASAIQHTIGGGSHRGGEGRLPASDVDSLIASIASRQHGVVCRRQLLAAGVGRRSIEAPAGAAASTRRSSRGLRRWPSPAHHHGPHDGRPAGGRTPRGAQPSLCGDALGDRPLGMGSDRRHGRQGSELPSAHSRPPHGVARRRDHQRGWHPNHDGPENAARPRRGAGSRPARARHQRGRGAATRGCALSPTFSSVIPVGPEPRRSTRSWPSAGLVSTSPAATWRIDSSTSWLRPVCHVPGRMHWLRLDKRPSKSTAFGGRAAWRLSSTAALSTAPLSRSSVIAPAIAH
jgi:hypothetical protein